MLWSAFLSMTNSGMVLKHRRFSINVFTVLNGDSVMRWMFFVKAPKIKTILFVWALLSVISWKRKGRTEVEKIREVNGYKLRNITFKKSGSFLTEGNPPVVYTSLHIFCQSRQVLLAETARVKMLTYFKAWRPSSGYLTSHSGVICHNTWQLSHSGRLQVRDGGARHLRDPVRAPSLTRWSVHLQKWPRDVNLRVGMLTGLWPLV